MVIDAPGSVVAPQPSQTQTTVVTWAILAALAALTVYIWRKVV